MAWANVPYVDVGTQITESFMDTYVKANFDALSGHTHSGADGDGSSNLDNVDTIIHDQQAVTHLHLHQGIVLYILSQVVYL